MLPSIYFLLLFLFGTETKAVKIEEIILRIPEVKGINLKFAARSKDHGVLAFVDRTEAKTRFHTQATNSQELAKSHGKMFNWNQDNKQNSIFERKKKQ